MLCIQSEKIFSSGPYRLFCIDPRRQYRVDISWGFGAARNLIINGTGESARAMFNTQINFIVIGGVFEVKRPSGKARADKGSM